ncbi:MAG: hypothetical protein ACR2IE_16750 [Candidatus Sumerlaeaceae bacterium]
MSRQKENEPEYLRLDDAAKRLGLGLFRRSARVGKKKVSEYERLARTVRRLIENGQLQAVEDDAGRYVVREDWLEEYAARRAIRSKYRVPSVRT